MWLLRNVSNWFVVVVTIELAQAHLLITVRWKQLIIHRHRRVACKGDT